MEIKLISEEEKHARTWAMLSHLAGLAGCFMPWLAHLAAPLIVWLVKRNDHPFIDAQGKESLNFQISMALYSLIGCALLAVTIVGFLAMPFFLWALYVLNIIGVVVASIQTSGGKNFKYSYIIRFIK